MALADRIELSFPEYETGILPLNDTSKTWSGMGKSNPRLHLGKVICDRHTDPAWLGK